MCLFVFQEEIRPQFEAKYSKKERMNPISGKPEPYQAFTDKCSRLIVSASGIFFMVWNIFTELFYLFHTVQTCSMVATLIMSCICIVLENIFFLCSVI